MPAMRLNSVLLPQPDGPTMATKSPASAVSETSRSVSSGCRPSNVLSTLLTRSSAPEAAVS